MRETQENLRKLRRWVIALAVWAALVTVLAAGAFSEARDVDSDEEHIAAELRHEIAAVRDLHDSRLDELQAWERRVERKRIREQLNARVARLEQQVGTGESRHLR